MHPERCYHRRRQAYHPLLSHKPGSCGAKSALDMRGILQKYIVVPAVALGHAKYNSFELTFIKRSDIRVVSISRDWFQGRSTSVGYIFCPKSPLGLHSRARAS